MNIWEGTKCDDKISNINVNASKENCKSGHNITKRKFRFSIVLIGEKGTKYAHTAYCNKKDSANMINCVWYEYRIGKNNYNYDFKEEWYCIYSSLLNKR